MTANLAKCGYCGNVGHIRLLAQHIEMNHMEALGSEEGWDRCPICGLVLLCQCDPGE